MTVLQSQLRLSLDDRVTGRMRAISAQVGAFQSRMRGMIAPFTGVTARIAGVAAGYVGVTAGMRGTVGAAIAFESAFADVKKVVEATPEQFDNMARAIKKMSTELPLTAVDIAALWAAAGESGIANNELKSFAEMAARVGIAFDMSAGEAGDSLAKLKAQLGLTVEETGLMADAINHLSNNMASKASQITAYMLRVGKFAEMGGFAKEQVAAIGSAMISAGAEAETAGTAMMNVVRKMTTGEFAKKDQREAAKALGLDLPTLAKQMKKDAPKALKTVLKAIAKAPEEKQIALLSKFFGDEARAFAPLVGNIELLDQALDSVADRTKYAGSAFQEYVQRAGTAANALQILRNKIAYVFEGIGQSWLPSIKEGVGAIGEVLDTLGERATPFDKLSAAMKGFLQGLGYDGSLRDVIKDIGDLLFGKADPAKAGEELGRVFMKFKEWGAAVREFNDAIKDNPVAKFIGEIAGQGFKLMLATVGFGLLAGAIMKIGRALMFLSGASAAIAILKSLAGIGGAIFGAAGGGGGDKPKKGDRKSGRPGAKPRTPARLPPVVPLGKGPKGIAGVGVVVGGAILGYAMSLLKDWEGGVWEIPGPPKPRPSPVVDKLNEWRDDAKARAIPPTGRDRVEDERSQFEKDAAAAKANSAGKFDRFALPSTEEGIRAFNQMANGGGMFERFLRGMESLRGPETVVPSPADTVRALRDAVFAGITALDNSLPSPADTASAQQVVGGAPAAPVVPSPVDAIRALTDKLGFLTQPPPDPIPTLQSIRDAVGRPTATQEVREVNPTPVHAPINVTVYATTNADPNQIAAQVGAKVQDQIAGYYGTSAYE